VPERVRPSGSWTPSFALLKCSGPPHQPTGGKQDGSSASSEMVADGIAASNETFRTLIALTARRHGATVVTAKRADFELLAREIPLSLFTV
jgi:hypothetical protein